MTRRETLRVMATERPWLFEQLYAFNYRPADYLHPSRRPAAASAWNDSLWDTPRARIALSEFLLREHALADRPCVDLDRAEAPLALLDASRLPQLALTFGALVLAPLARRSLARADVLAWRERLTPQAHDFAMRSAGLLPLAGLLPADPPDDAPLDIGFDWLAASLEQAPFELRERALMKLPASARRGHADPAAAAQAVPRVLATLEPQWHSSFARAAH